MPVWKIWACLEFGLAANSEWAPKAPRRTDENPESIAKLWAETVKFIGRNAREETREKVMHPDVRLNIWDNQDSLGILGDAQGQSLMQRLDSNFRCRRVICYRRAGDLHIKWYKNKAKSPSNYPYAIYFKPRLATKAGKNSNRAPCFRAHNWKYQWKHLKIISNCIDAYLFVSLDDWNICRRHVFDDDSFLILLVPIRHTCRFLASILV